MKRISWIFFIILNSAILLNAIPVSLYIGSSNSFCFPIIRADLPSTLTSFGFSGNTEVGVDLLGWQFGGLFNASLWGEGSGKEGLMKNFISIQLGLAISKEFDNSLIPILPKWLGFHPTVSIRYGVFHTEHYRTSLAKILGSFNNEWDQVVFINTGLFVDFYPGNYATLFVGADVTGWYDEDTVVFTPAVTAGVKIHPNRKKYLEEKKNSVSKRKKTIKKSEKLKAKLTIVDDYFGDDNCFIPFELSADIPGNRTCKKWKLEVYNLAGKLFFQTGAKGDFPPVINWDGIGNKSKFVSSGSEYFCKFTITDNLGNVASDTQTLLTAFPVQYLGKNLRKIELSSIVFSANRWSLDEVSPNQKLKNEKRLDEVARFIKKASYSHIYIVGHANNVRRKSEDEEKLWIPLSKARAEEVRKALVKRGIEMDKITIEAKGGRFPVSTNKYEVWRNRRVEIFIESISSGGSNEK